MRGLRGYGTVIKPPHTHWPTCPLVLLLLGGESGGPGAEPGPLSQRLAPQCARESHHRPSQPSAGSTWLRVGTCPQHGILSSSALDSPAWSKHIPTCSKTRSFETEIPACFYIQMAPQCLAPRQAEVSFPVRWGHPVGCACGGQGCGRKELPEAVGPPFICLKPCVVTTALGGLRALLALPGCLSPAGTRRQPWMFGRQRGDGRSFLPASGRL